MFDSNYMESNEMKTEEIGEIFTEEGFKALHTGQLLRFDYEGSITELVITKLNRKSGKCWVREAKTYLPDETKVENNGNEEAS